MCNNHFFCFHRYHLLKIVADFDELEFVLLTFCFVCGIIKKNITATG